MDFVDLMKSLDAPIGIIVLFLLASVRGDVKRMHKRLHRVEKRLWPDDDDATPPHGAGAVGAVVILIFAGLLLLPGCGDFRHAPMTTYVHPMPAPDPLTGYLVYGVLAGILGVGVGVAMFVWLPFKRTAVAIAAGSGSVIAACLTLRSVLPYVGWIVLAGGIVGVAVLLWHNRRLLVAARESWDHVPEEAVVSAKVEKLMERIG